MKEMSVANLKWVMDVKIFLRKSINFVAATMDGQNRLINLDYSNLLQCYLVYPVQDISEFSGNTPLDTKLTGIFS